MRSKYEINTINNSMSKATLISAVNTGCILGECTMLWCACPN